MATGERWDPTAVGDVPMGGVDEELPTGSG
jgi:hypothetical protein